jgi:hypothetical protein
MSYETKSTIHPFIHVYLDGDLDNSLNYGGSGTANGFPYGLTDNSGGNLTYNTNTNTNSITINVKGLYLISYCFNVRNNSDTTGGDQIDFGVSVSGDTFFRKYYGEIDPERLDSSVRYIVSNSVFVSCDNGNVIKGYVGGSSNTHTFVGTNRGATSLSIGLIAPYS